MGRRDEDRRLASRMARRAAGAPEEFQTAYTPLLRYIIAPILHDQRDRALRRAVDGLSPWDRNLFLRKYYYYQSTAQMAAELGLTVRGVEERLYRIRKRLQKELRGDWHD